jgi:glycosyltransferase involved in cell wall biosynthesis
MKVLMLGRLDLMTIGGGDKVQIVNTAAELRNLGIEVDIRDDTYNVDVSSYDVVHIFQLDWGSDAYFHTKNVKAQGKPIVLSPIHHLLSEVERFDKEYVFDYRRLAKYLCRDQFGKDVLKNFYRSLFNPRKLKPTFESAIRGLKNMHREALELADIVLVQTEMEARDLEEVYGIDLEWKRAVNGVGKQFIVNEAVPNKLGFENYLISVGRIEARKNQLSIIQAVKKLRAETGEDIKLVLIGKKIFMTHMEYTIRTFWEIRKNKDWITYIEQVPYEEMQGYYQHAKVGISASWFESTGLTLLEALFCGANVVAASEPTKEYLGGYATYCDPGNIGDIKNSIKMEYYAARPTVDLALKAKYTWENAARETLAVYNKLLK